MYICFGDQTEFLQSIEIKKEVNFIDPFAADDVEPVTYWLLIINGRNRDHAYCIDDFRVIKGVYESIIEELKRNTAFINYGQLYDRERKVVEAAKKKGSDSVE